MMNLNARGLALTRIGNEDPWKVRQKLQKLALARCIYIFEHFLIAEENLRYKTVELKICTTSKKSQDDKQFFL